jgi:chemosensory pili system protein ChpA (sensor histidine kinase/response regulator)
LQEELLQTRMVRFQGITSRLRRVIRQTAGQLGKKVELEIRGEDNEIDRSVQERMIAPLEHMLRNAVFHGIEKPEARAAAGKPETGLIRIDIGRDGSYIVMNVSDDGQGMDAERIRKKAVQLGLMAEDEQRPDQDIFQFIMHEGFTTADDVSQIAGRGVGMDVVDTEIKQLGGNLTIHSEWGRGTTFNIRLPLTLAINQALLIRLEEDIYAIPLTAIEGVAVLNANEIRENLAGKRKYYEYAGETYDMHYLGLLLGTGVAPAITNEGRYPLLLLRSAGRRIAVHVDAMLGRREIVVKPVGPQITTIPGISGATILADGRVALIIDVTGLLRKESSELTTSATVLRSTTFMKPVQTEPVVMVVDDSITIRKVTARILGRHKLRVVTAKDGLDAIQQLQEITPDLFLMDIEMPRMDGFELAIHVKSDSRLESIPIIMITSRTGEKHRERARQIGVDRYLGKPFQEAELMSEINELLDREST